MKDLTEERITDVQLELLSKLLGMRQDLTALIRRQRCQLTSIEPRIFETETAVHTVGRELECLLSDIELRAILARTGFSETVKYST